MALEAIQAQAGHASIESTRIYLHLANDWLAGEYRRGDDTWTESRMAPGVVLIGVAAGYNDLIIGDGLAIALRDARILGDLLVAQPEWDSNSLAPYAMERAERVRRLRFTASLVAALQADFSPGARDRRARFY